MLANVSQIISDPKSGGGERKGIRDVVRRARGQPPFLSLSISDHVHQSRCTHGNPGSFNWILGKERQSGIAADVELLTVRLQIERKLGSCIWILVHTHQGSKNKFKLVL